MFPRKKVMRHQRGQADHVDAWLMSYADFITLLCMFFVIFVAVPHASQENEPTTNEDERYPDREERFGALRLKTPFDEAYRVLVGMAAKQGEEQNIAVEQTERGLKLELSAMVLFEPGTAELSAPRLALLRDIARTVRESVNENTVVEVEGYSDDGPLIGPYANHWELAALRATRVVGMLAEEGVESSRLKAVSHGANKPLVPNADAHGTPIPPNRMHNQRVIIRMLTRPPEGPRVGLVY